MSKKELDPNFINPPVEEVETPVEAADEEEVIERPYQLRKLKDGDLFPLLKLFRKIGLKEFKDALMQYASGKSLEEVGVLVILDMADVIIGNLDKVEDEVYDFWSSLSGLPVEDMKEMEFGTLPLMIYDSFNEVKNTSFFKVLSKLL